jgi:hypothetical protein
MTDIYDGDPLLILGPDGADLVFNGGQPVMGTGLLNHVNLSLLTESGHWSEDLEDDVHKRYTGYFLKQKGKPITRQSLIDRSRAAEADAAGPEFRSVSATITNPTSQSIFLNLTLTPPTGDEKKLRLINNGENWIQQRDDPKNDILNNTK